jgi:peptide/nickel transport system substrate-binding protein
MSSRLAVAGLCLLAGCGGEQRPGCAECTVVVAAIGEPTSLVPPLVGETVARDISDQIYSPLAYLAPHGSPIDTSAFRPGLAERWERVDSLTWRFHLRPGATWQDGRRVTAQDVVFSFEAFTDSTLNSPARDYLEGRVRVTAEDSSTVLVAFAEPSPEQLYDATFHVRVIPRHIWDTIPRERWAADTSLGHLVGTGPYHITSWHRGSSLTLAADTIESDSRKMPAIRRVIWRFATDPDAALNLLLSHEADLMETVGSPDRVKRVAGDTNFRLVSYPAAVYGFLAFRVADAKGRPHPILGNRELRRALAQAINRPAIAQAVFGEGTRPPPGPMSQLLWIWDDGIESVPFDSTRARAALDRLKSERHVKGIDILIPATSNTRRQLALAIQEAWRKAGINSTVTTVEFPVFQEWLTKGRFDSYIGAYLDEPSPRGLSEQWTRAGWAATNYGHYANPAFDSVLRKAASEGDVGHARKLWREAMDTLNADVPAVFLYSLMNVAAVSRRLENVRIDPYSWISGLPEWRVRTSRPGTRRDHQPVAPPGSLTSASWEHHTSPKN